MKTKTNIISRAGFIRATMASVAVTLFPGMSGRTQSTQQDRPAPLAPELVKEFVGVSHSKIDRVKEMLENEHLLLHSSYDWGGGDFESPIEAAGHVGNKEIALYLLSKGARYNIYLACMLGHLETVKNVVAFNPQLIHSKGPHGFTMLHHAQKGGEEAAPVVEFLQSQGASVTRIDFYTRS